MKDFVKEYYSTLYVPEKNTPSRNHISVPVSTSQTIDQIVYEYLKQESLINEELGPILIKTQYLKENEFVDTNQLYETLLRTPGERRPVSRQVLENAIKDGVLKGEFGLGETDDEKPVCKYFGNGVYPAVSFDPGEVIIRAETCKSQMKQDKNPEPEPIKIPDNSIDISPRGSDPKEITRLLYSFLVPEGTINYTSGMFLNIAEKFKQFKLTINADDGQMTVQDVENLKETLRQMGAKSDLFTQFNDTQ